MRVWTGLTVPTSPPCKSEVRAGGRVLARLLELKEEVKQSLREEKSDLVQALLNEEWMAKLAYMADMFNLNKLNISFQGFCTTIFTLINIIYI